MYGTNNTTCLVEILLYLRNKANIISTGSLLCIPVPHKTVGNVLVLTHDGDVNNIFSRPRLPAASNSLA